MTIAAVSAGLSNASHALLETPSCRVFLSSPRATPEGITCESLEDPIPGNALHLPNPVPWTDVRSIEAQSPVRLPLALALGTVGAIIGHMLWTGSSRSIMVDGHPIYVRDRQAYYVVGGIEAGMVTGLMLNARSSRTRRVYPVGGE